MMDEVEWRGDWSGEDEICGIWKWVHATEGQKIRCYLLKSETKTVHINSAKIHF